MEGERDPLGAYATYNRYSEESKVQGEARRLADKTKGTFRPVLTQASSLMGNLKKGRLALEDLHFVNTVYLGGSFS